MNKTCKQAVALGVGLLCAMAAQAELRVSDPWVRGTVSQQRATAAFMQLHSTEALQLVGARSDAADTTEVHEMTREGDVMKMKAVHHLDLPAGQTVALTPGGHHLMLMGLKAPLSEGQSVAIELTLKKMPSGETITQTVSAPVRPLAGPAASGHQHGHEHAGHGHGGAHKH